MGGFNLPIHQTTRGVGKNSFHPSTRGYVNYQINISESNSNRYSNKHIQVFYSEIIYQTFWYRFTNFCINRDYIFGERDHFLRTVLPRIVKLLQVIIMFGFVLRTGKIHHLQ